MDEAATVGAPWPEIIPTTANRFFWEGAASGLLLVLRCEACGELAHPPPERCGACGSPNLVPQALSGRGRIYSFTVIRRVFHPGFAGDVPYVVALVELAEQAELHLLTAIVDCPPERVRIGMDVSVAFERRGNHSRPVFRLSDAIGD